MDGYEDMVKTHTWEALKKAQASVFALREALKGDGLSDDGELFDARLALSNLDNRLRSHFRGKPCRNPWE